MGSVRRYCVVACVIEVAACGSVQPTGPGDGGLDALGDTADAAAPVFSMLWVPQYNLSQVRGYPASRTIADGAGPPDIVLTLAAGCHPNAVAFDRDGNLWATCNGNNQLLGIAQSDLATSGAPVPRAVITSDGQSMLAPIGLIQDSAGSFWVACADRLEMYTPASQAAGGARPPDRTIMAGFDIPAGLVFDGAGNLWVNNASFTVASNSVLVFAAAQVAAGGAQTPRLTLTSSTFSLVEGIAFDGAGSLWVASNNGPAIGRFEASAVTVPAAATTRSLLPAARLEGGASVRTVRKPGSIVFDGSGNLLVTSELGDTPGDDARVVRYTAAQLAALTGDVPLEADVVIGNAASSPGFGGVALR
jgi:hypothetical protein